MIDINLIRKNKDLVKENIKKKFQDDKLVIVDEIFDLDIKTRNMKNTCDNLRKEKND
ncbi:MAG: serine--tRNA ligase, partial [Bacilli bacterium]